MFISTTQADDNNLNLTFANITITLFIAHNLLRVAFLWGRLCCSTIFQKPENARRLMSQYNIFLGLFVRGVGDVMLEGCGRFVDARTTRRYRILANRFDGWLFTERYVFLMR